MKEPEDIESLVCADIQRRQKLGLQKYGQTVAKSPAELKEWLEHAYFETLDKAIYLKRAIAEIDKTSINENKIREAFNKWVANPSGWRWDGFKKEIGV